jgi:hypothetical protein
MSAVACVILPLLATAWLADGGLLSLLFIAGVVAAVFAGKAAWRCLAQSRAHGCDLQQGVVLGHSGSAPDGTGGAKDYRIEMLPASGTAWRINGDLLPRTGSLTPYRVADVPEIAAVAAQWLQPVPQHSDSPDAPKISRNQRELSPSERAEIRQHRRGLIWNGWFILYAFDIFYAAALWDHFASSPNRETLETLYFAAITVGVLCLHGRPLQQLLLSRRIARDLAHGSVIIIGYTAANTPSEESEASEPSEPEASVIFELLPSSHLIWTTEGAPAPWRTLAVE